MVRQRARIRFSKQGDLRLIGHRDLARLMERLFRRAGLRLAMSQGFHPKPRMSYPLALALGIEGRREVMELELAEPLESGELLARLRAQTVAGLEFASAEILPEGAKKARVRSATYEAPVPAARQAQAAPRVAELWAGTSCPVQRPDGGPTLDVRTFLEALRLEQGVLAMRLAPGPERSAGPRDVLTALGLEDLEHQGAVLARTDVELWP